MFMNDLTGRSQKIIGILTETEGFTPISRIAEQLEVSARTIIRELKGIEVWLAERKVHLLSKPGQGILLDLDPAGMQIIREELKLQESIGEFSPRERQAYLLVELLNASEPLKLYCFTSALNVSEGTISNDLDKIEPIVNGWNLRLIRKPGYGIEIEGDEKHFRTAISHLIFEHFTRAELLDIIRRKYQGTVPRLAMSAVRNRLLNTIGDDILEGIEEAIGKTEALKNYPIADNSYVGLVVHMALAVKRLMNGERITFDPKILEELRESKEYDIARVIVIETGKIFDINIPEDETGYVTMHLKGVKYGNTLTDTGKIHVNDYRIIHLANELIRKVEQDTGYLLQNNNRLLIGLVNHLGPALARIQLGLEIQNPLLEEIKTRYTDYYEMTARSVRVIEDKVGVSVPEDEIGYLAMHFGAALEEQTLSIHRVFRVVIVCSTGIGSSKLLEARIRKHYETIRIVESRSVINLDDYLRGHEDVDFVISTVPVQGLERPVAVVSPLLLEQDMEKINRVMKALAATVSGKRQERIGIDDFAGSVEALGQLTESVRTLVGGFTILNRHVSSKQDLIWKTVQALYPESEQGSIARALQDREAAGTTVFDQGRGLLLHCRSLDIKKPILSIVLLTKENDEASDLPEKLRYCVVMIAPDKMSESMRAVFGEVSRNLVENPQWTDTLLSGQAADIRRQLEKILKQMIRRQSMELDE